MDLPRCNFCGFEAQNRDNVWILTDMPDIVTEGDGDKYIGYECIGEGYSGKRKYLIEERYLVLADEVAGLTGDGIFLDLGCGDGCLTVSCASLGIKIIAGDISCAMLSILQKKAEKNNISLENVTLCRMNALDIPLGDETVHTVVANSVLHLISYPEKVVGEIHRVLKKGGAFICQDDRPGVAREAGSDNAKHNEIVKELYNRYWDIMTGKGINPVKFSWRFDRDAFCDRMFDKKTSKLIKRGSMYEISLEDGFLARFISKGFSDQVEVPDDLHDEVIRSLLDEFEQKYGDDLYGITYKGVEDDILLTIYIK